MARPIRAAVPAGYGGTRFSQVLSAQRPMHLKRLIVHGFKSFADRTVFDFERGGLTCVVGPNGCGKSNVFEAIRWVLGEQRPTSLRSRELTDVIFNGTVRRPPMGMCQGTIVFDNESGTLGTDATEVEVTRRVFRSGETDYLVNGSPVRLKDIRDLFAGTGLGAGGYAFMEQGRIDQVLASNAVERRRVFEEAAGISRFRSRKREAVLKLNRVEDNLTRLHDIVEEINRQIRSLKIHAGKARSHREMTSRVRDLQLSYSVHRFEAIKTEQQRLQDALQEIESSRAQRNGEREGLRVRMREVESELEALMERVGGFRTRYAEVAGKIATCKEKIGLQTGYVDEVAQRLQVKTEEISSLRLSLTTLEEERVVALREREAFDHDRERLSGELRRLEEDAAASREKGEELAEECLAAQAYLRDLEQREAGHDRDIARLEAELEHLEAGAAANKESRGRIDHEREDLRASLDERTGRQDAQTSVLEERRVALTAEERLAEDREQQYAAAIEELRGYEAELDRARARADVVQGTLAKGEGLDEGTRALLEEHRGRPKFLAGFRGLLLDLIEIDLDHASAIQAVLGDASEALVVETAEEALEGLRWLRDNDLGCARFLPLDRFVGVRASQVPGVRAKDKDLAPVLAALVGGLEIVDEEAFGSSLTGGSKGSLVVTAEGDIAKDGRFVTSAVRGKGVRGLVVLQAELQDLERRLPGLEETRDRSRDELGAKRAARDASRERIKKLSVALVNEEGESARLDQEIVRVVRDLDRLKSESERLVEGGALVERKRGEAQAGLVDAQDAKAAVAEDMAEASREVDAQTSRLEEHRRERDRDARALEEIRVDSTKVAERLDALLAKDAHFSSSIDETKRRLEADERDVIEFERNRDETARGMEADRTSLGQLQQESTRISESLGERERDADGVRERLRETAEALDSAEAGINALTEKLSSFRGREGELKAAMEGLLERSRDELDLDLLTDELPDVAPPQTEDGEEVDWKAIELEIRELRNRIARLGNVNLAAVEELEDAEGRAGFIFRERDDLMDARDQLNRVLKEIETQSTQMFVDTFAAVSEHFSTIFRRLFGGGKAEIFLEDPDSPLESGIEIKARPPGKEFRSITLLSGGERTMTAVALLFAIFRAHPAPCAFLDEVDAALDEDNTERFCFMLEDFTAESQFVVVTHSKRTMEKAALLYGVTMPERGVSRRIAVQLEQLDAKGQLVDLAQVNKQARAEASEEVASVEEPEVVVEADALDELASAPRVLEAPAMARRSSQATPPAEAEES